MLGDVLDNILCSYLFQHLCIAISSADPGPSADTDGLAEAQSGAAPTAEGKIETPLFVF